MKEFNFIRHGSKLGTTEKRETLENSGLSQAQQEKWQESAESLRLDDPEITYETLPKIEELGQAIYDSLPEKATVIFVTTDTPRTKMTADFLSTELYYQACKRGKEIGVSFLLDTSIEKDDQNSLINAIREVPGILSKMKTIQERDYADDTSLANYFAGKFAGKTHPKEMELFFKAVNEDLGSENSIIKKRAEQLKAQVEKIKDFLKNYNEPVYFFGVTHMSSLIALDVAFNNRQKYDSANEMPEPLSVWKVNIDVRKQ